MTEYHRTPMIENDGAIREELDRRHIERLQLDPRDIGGVRDPFGTVRT